MSGGFPNMKVTVSKSSDAIYAYINPDLQVIRTEDMSPSKILIDLAANGKIVGIEFLGVHGNHIEVDGILDKYAKPQVDSVLTVGDAYMLRLLSLIEWNLI